jgi:hypothetical protein
VLGGHPIEDARDFDVIQCLHELDQRVVVELREKAARLLGIEDAKDRDQLIDRQVAQGLRQVSGVGLLAPWA